MDDYRRFTQRATVRSLRKAWRCDEVNRAERVATADERAIRDRVGKRALAEPVATAPGRIGEVRLCLSKAARSAVERTDRDHPPDRAATMPAVAACNSKQIALLRPEQ